MGRLFGFAKNPHIVGCLLLAWILMPSGALAQSPDAIAAQGVVGADPPAHISFVDGSAVLERDGQRDASPMNMPLLSGDRVRTENGRVEILFADNSTLHLDADTIIDFESDDLVRLLAGRIRVAIPGPDRQVSYRIDAPAASAVITQPGEYRVSILRQEADDTIELAVLRGGAELVNDDGRTALRAGQRAYASRNAAPSYAYAFNSATWDSFDRWSEARRDQRVGVSAQYLPNEVRPYASSFDQYGTWQYNTSYGYVWYPSVAVDWRPYYSGRWVAYRPYGWTWVGANPWGWPTHHYGRWGFSAGAWFWIPGRTWGPAWVSWAYAPGYVSWCPLGWNNQAVLSFGFNFGYDPWRAWTVLPYGHFGHGFVNVNYIGGRAFDARTRATFVPRYTAPTWRGYAVPRSTTPIRVAGTAQPRGSSTVYTNLEPNGSRVGQAGRRVMVGPARSSAAESRPGVASEGGRAVTRDVPAESPRSARDAAQRSLPGAGVQDRPANSARTAIPRGDSTYRGSVSGQPASGGTIDRNQAVAPRADVPSNADGRNVRRTPPPSGSGDPRTQTDPRVRAVPRGYPSYGGRAPEVSRPAGAESPGAVMIPRGTPDAQRSTPPDSRQYGYGAERRGPAASDRPSGPPPESARPAPRENRGNPGNDRGASAPSNGGGAPAQGGGHSRGGESSSGRAVPRGRG